MLKVLWAALVLLSLIAATSHAQAPESVIVDVGSCVDLESREAQLECLEVLLGDELRAPDAEVAGDGSSSGSADPGTATAASEASEPEGSIPPLDDVRTSDLSSESIQASEDIAPAAPLTRSERRAQRERERERRDQETVTVSEFTATVMELRELEPNHWLITLDNDQVWRQNRPERYWLEVGAEVTLRSSPWGPSYRLTVPNRGGFIQVERVR